MVILDKPYVSTFMQNTLKALNIPVLKNFTEENMLSVTGLNIFSESAFLDRARTESPLLLYCNSENSIHWIDQNLSFTDIPQKIEVFKDKVRFRKLIQPIDPDFFFQEVAYEHLDQVDPSKLPIPFIIKPAIGFFSMGVYKVADILEWPHVLEQIKSEMKQVQGLYPSEVMNASRFIIEACIEGDEFAIDAYYNHAGHPVILNILKHPFSSEKDVSDRLYYTSKAIIETYLKPFEAMLASIGKLADVKNFPIHVEVRVDAKGSMAPIEVNPMRFAGWCTTDIAHYAYGINPYEYYFHQKAPDWESILKTDDGRLTCLVIADLPKDIPQSDIEAVDYQRFVQRFDRLFELRKIDHREYPVFAFAFVGLDSADDIDPILQLDLSEYLVVKIK